MVMQLRGDKCYPGRGKWVKIPLLPENVGKGVLTTLERVTTCAIWSGILFYNSTSCNKLKFEFQTHPYGSPLHSYVSSQDLFTSQVQGQRRSSSAGSGSVTPQILLTHSNSARPFPVYTGSQEPRPESQQVKANLFYIHNLFFRGSTARSGCRTKKNSRSAPHSSQFCKKNVQPNFFKQKFYFIPLRATPPVKFIV